MSGPTDRAAALDALATLAAVSCAWHEDDPDVDRAARALAAALESRVAPLHHAMSDELAAAHARLIAALNGAPPVNVAPVFDPDGLTLAAYDVAAYSLCWHAPDVVQARATLAAVVDRARLAAYAPAPAAAMERLTAAARHADNPDALAHVYPDAVEPDAAS